MKEKNGSGGDDAHVCRCEEIGESAIIAAIRAGASTVNEVKRWTRAGMGLCQGRSCRRLVERILASELGIAPGEILTSTYRQPVRPVAIDAFDVREDETKGA